MNLRRHDRPVLPAFDAHPELPAAGPHQHPHWLNVRRVRAYAYAALFCEFGFLFTYVVRLYGPHADKLTRLTMDFTPTWSAAWLTVRGRALDAWHADVLRGIEEQAIPAMHGISGGLPWLYPPTMQLLAAPLGWLPYALAAALWLGGALAAFVAVSRATAQRDVALLCAVAFPGAFFNVIVGQNGLFTASLAGLGLLLLQRRPIAAGICFGLLAVKPQLAVLCPLALLCASQWRALLAWAATLAIGIALATLALGPDAWLAFAHGMGDVYRFIGGGHAMIAHMPTAFAMATLADFPTWAANALQALSIAFALFAVGYAWRGSCTYALRAATLVCASLLVSPYLHDYDLAWYGLVIAWYVRHALTHGWRRFDREWLVLLWLIPLGGSVATHLQFQFMPLITIATLARLLARIAHERRAAPCLPDMRDSATETGFAHVTRPRHAALRFQRPLPPLGSHR
jgi:hypothetical protein